MPIKMVERSFPPELQQAWGAEGQNEYSQLLRVVRAARGSFFLFLIESDYSPALRDMLLDCLRADLAEDLPLRRVELTTANWDVSRLSELESPSSPYEAIVLVGIENTPGLVQEPGRRPTRPPIFALLNCLRETLHVRLPSPFLVWCTPSVYNGLQTHAPDFFDHYAGLFQFYNIAPDSLPDRVPTYAGTELSSSTNIISPAAQRVVAFYEQQLAQHPKPTRERAHVLLGLADALIDLRGPGNIGRIQRTMEAVDEALSILSMERNTYEWARGQIIKGIAYGELPIGDRLDNLNRAIACFEAALQYYTEEKSPQDWAMAQNNLGLAYKDLPLGDRRKNLRRSIACFKAALRVYTEEYFPADWAGTQNNLGNAYLDLPNNDRGGNYNRAIACYEAALKVYTEAQFPQDWAGTQNNLAVAYRNHPVGDVSENYSRAIACHEAALRVRTEERFPEDWARTQNNLGNAYLYLLSGNPVENLDRAIACYEAALRVYNDVTSPHYWAQTQSNLATAYRQANNLEGARRAMQHAVRGFRAVGLEHEALRAEGILHREDWQS